MRSNNLFDQVEDEVRRVSPALVGYSLGGLFAVLLFILAVLLVDSVGLFIYAALMILAFVVFPVWLVVGLVRAMFS